MQLLPRPEERYHNHTFTLEEHGRTRWEGSDGGDPAYVQTVCFGHRVTEVMKFWGQK